MVFFCTINTAVLNWAFTEVRMIVAQVIFTWYQTVTDGRSDRQNLS